MTRGIDAGFFSPQIHECKKLYAYSDELVAPLAWKHDLDSLSERVELQKKELKKDIEEAQNTIKFDLLHDPSPQVDNLKVIIDMYIFEWRPFSSK